jgi:Ca2+-binding RTX toxin-like protein
LFGGEGRDRLLGGAGNDSLDGGGVNGTIIGGTGNDTAFGGTGDDSFIWNPGDGDDTFDGGAGTDTLVFNGSGADERMTITTLAGGGFQFFRNVGDITVDNSTVERVDVDGLGGNDTIDGSAQTNPGVSLEISGGAGDDRLTGGAGNDSIIGNTGNDTALGGAGNDSFTWNPGDGDDTFDGGAGTDTLVFNGAGVAEQMTITTLIGGGFRFFRNVGDITVDITSVERVDVDGLGGNDTIDGSAQTNTGVALEISGGAGNDSLTGGAGADTFVFGAETSNGVTETDLIFEYSESELDVIDLSVDVLNTQVVAGNLRLTLAGVDNDIIQIQGITSIADLTIL